jgi:hypothetical protein
LYLKEGELVKEVIENKYEFNDIEKIILKGMLFN